MALQVIKNTGGGASGGVASNSPPLAGQTMEKKLLNSLDFSQKAHVSMFYGDSRTLKSWEWLRVARYVLRTTGKITRVVYSDLGGFNAVKEAESAGLIQLVKLADVDSPAAALMKLSRGEWPIAQDGNVQAEWPKFQDNGGDEVGMYVFDSLSSLAALAMTELVEKRQRVGQDVVGAYEFHGEKFGNPSMAHYGSVQWGIRRILMNIANLPTPYVIITALEGVGKDEAGRSIYGPQAIGKALTDSLPAMTGDLWRFELTKEGEYRAWFTHSPDPQTGIMWPANIRLDGEGLVEWLKLHPKGYMQHGQVAGKSISDYLEFYSTHSQGLVEDMKKEVEKYKRKG